jgi:DNA modification methylase
VRRVLKSNGTCWVNLGDSYVSDAKNRSVEQATARGRLLGSYKSQIATLIQPKKAGKGLKSKDLVGIPWMVAFALRADGWYLRSDIIWHKPNPMPESVSDRPTKSHEYLFLLSKRDRYFYDAEAIKETVSGTANARRSYKTPDGWDTSSGEGGHGDFHRNGREKGHTDYIATPRSFNGSVPGRKDGPGQDRRSKNDRQPGVCPKSAAAGSGIKANESFHAAVCDLVDNRNKRSVWTVPTSPFPEAHFATYPPDLIKPCILAGSKPGDVILDPFGGSGTTGMVALELARKAILIELNPEYVKLIERRCSTTLGLGF